MIDAGQRTEIEPRYGITEKGRNGTLGRKEHADGGTQNGGEQEYFQKEARAPGLAAHDQNAESQHAADTQRLVAETENGVNEPVPLDEVEIGLPVEAEELVPVRQHAIRIMEIRRHADVVEHEHQHRGKLQEYNRLEQERERAEQATMHPVGRQTPL